MAHMSGDDLEAEIRALRADLAQMRLEQQEMARSIEQMTQTFRSLAMHLGLAADPYKRSDAKRDRELPGFA